MTETESSDLLTLSGTGYHFTAILPENIKTDAICLASVLIDTSSSMDGEEQNLERCFEQAIQACDKAPNRDGIFIRITSFASTVKELRPFIPPSPTPLKIHIGGMTALGRGILDSLRSTTQYAKVLSQGDYRCNAILIILTDGEETVDKPEQAVDMVQKELQTIRTEETLDSVLIILVGFRPSVGVMKTQQDFANAIGARYIPLQDVNPQKLAKLANFVSQSISSQSKQIGTGQVTQVPQLD